MNKELIITVIKERIAQVERELAELDVKRGWLERSLLDPVTSGPHYAEINKGLTEAKDQIKQGEKLVKYLNDRLILETAS